MTSKVWYRASSGRDYELSVLHEDDQYVPKFISEDDEGVIVDLSSDRNWESLPAMTKDLEVEIIGCDTADEVGN